MSRPTVYNAKEHPAVAERLATNGATIAEIAEVVGVTGTTIKNWMQAHPVFLAAIKAGREAAVDRAERALFERATGYSWKSEKLMTLSDPGGGSHVERIPISVHAPPDVAAIRFYLSNRRRREWAERYQS